MLRDIVFRKRYAFKPAFLQYRHEAAYLLVKGKVTSGTPARCDGLYLSGNKHYPTPAILYSTRSPVQARHASQPITGPDYIGIELEAKYHARQRQN